MSTNTPCLLNISQNFLCGLPVCDLGLEKVLSALCDTENGVLYQENLLSLTVNHPLVLKHPLKHDYQRSFLRSIIEKLEKFGVEISDKLYSRYCDLLTDVCGDTSFRHYCLINDDVIISLRESTSLVSKGTTGLRTWEASHALINWCAENTSVLKGAYLLELGSGIGLSGIAVSLLCKPSLYCFSDCHPDVLESLSKNIELNITDEVPSEHNIPSGLDKRALYVGQLRGSIVTVLNLPWEDVPTVDFSIQAPEFVLASDVVYDSSIFEVLSSAFETFAHSGSQIIMASTERNPETLAEFLKCLSSKGMQVEEENFPEMCVLRATRCSVTTKIFKVSSMNVKTQAKR